MTLPCALPSFLLVVSQLLCHVAASTSYSVFPWPAPSATGPAALQTNMGYGTVQSTGTRFNWYSLTLPDPSRFSYALSTTGCDKLQKTTVTAVHHQCVAAFNAGFFQFKPDPTFCLGVCFGRWGV